MFEHLPKITEGNLGVVAEKEIDYFKGLLTRCSEVTNTPDHVIDCMCRQLNRCNPYLVKAVKASAYSVAGQSEGDVEAGFEWKAGLACTASLLATLRLIDRALEAQEIEAKLSRRD